MAVRPGKAAVAAALLNIEPRQIPDMPHKDCALTIIMPVLNEAAGLLDALAALAPLVDNGVQVIIVDGGSTDATGAMAHASQSPVVTLVHAGPGRALQMNAGAAHATGKALLFLHADTVLPLHADALVQQALASGAQVWGRFDVRIVGKSAWLPVIAVLMNFRSRLTGIATGDQAIFMTQAAFVATGGYAAQPLMEDIDMSGRLLKLSKPACLRQKVMTSGRRWDARGVWRTIALMWRLRFAYWRGTAPERLTQLYR